MQENEERPIKKADELDDEFEARLDSFDAKAKPILERRKSERKESAKNMKQDGANARGLGVGLTISYALVGTPVAGALLGLLIDSASGTGRTFTATLTIAGAVIGLVFTIIVTNKFENRK